MLRHDAKIDLIKRAPLFAKLPKKHLAEIALITGAPRTATVTATEPVRTLVLTQRDFRTLLRREPEIQAKVLEALAERLPPEPL